MTKLNSAIEAARRGFRVFPLVPDTKTPSLVSWPVKATTDEATIREWWSGNCTVTTSKGNQLTLSPDCNIGICPGLDWIIIDVDTKNDSRGMRTFRELVDSGALPRTLMVQTPSGGIHLYYKNTKKLPIKSIANWNPDNIEGFKSGIDIRGHVGQGVAPGSSIGKNFYKILLDLPPIDLPDTTFQKLPLKNGQKVSAVESLIDEAAEPSPYSTLPDKIVLGERDDVLYRYSCSWRVRGYPIDHAKALMRDLHSRCEQSAEDPFTLEQALEKLERAYTERSPQRSPEWSSFLTPQNEVIEVPKQDLNDLQSFLDNFIFISDGSMVANLNCHPHRSRLSLQDFKNDNKNKVRFEFGPRGGSTKIYLANEWLEHPHRQTCRQSGYKPNDGRFFEEYGAQIYNIYSGSDHILPDKVDEVKIQPVLDHLRYLFPDSHDFNLFISWMAVTVQIPEERCTWAPLLVSDEGTGKGWIYHLMRECVGPHNATSITTKDLEGQFNDFLYQTTLVLLDDIIVRHHEIINTLKPMINAESYNINRKYGGKSYEKIYPNFILFSNYIDAMKLRADDRRYWVYYVMAKPRRPQYYTNLFKWLDTDGPAHFEKYLRNFDISQFDHKAPPPTTVAKHRMIAASRSQIDAYLEDGIKDKYDIFEFDIVSTNLVSNYIKNQLQKPFLSDSDIRQISRFLTNLGSALPNERPYMQIGDKRTQVRVKCVRNFDHWVKATPSDIEEEYLKAHSVAYSSPSSGLVQ